MLDTGMHTNAASAANEWREVSPVEIWGGRAGKSEGRESSFGAAAGTKRSEAMEFDDAGAQDLALGHLGIGITPAEDG
jgi:hypothetical protein